MSIAVMIVKFKNGAEQKFSIDEIESILTDYTKEKGHTGFSSGMAFLEQQPWFESCDLIPDNTTISAILIIRPLTAQHELEDVIFRLLAIENSVFMGEHFDIFHSRTDMKSHLPPVILEIINEMSATEDPVKTISSAREVWPAEYKNG